MRVKKNGGFSLVEVIVVIAIMGVMTAGSVVLYESLSTYKCKTAKDEICTNLRETKTEALAKRTEWMQIYRDAGGFKIKRSYNVNDTDLSSRLKISYVVQGSSAEIEIDNSTSLILTYARGSGSFEGIKTSTTPDANGKLPDQMNGSNIVYCKEIHVRNPARTKGYTITLHQETGKFVCKDD